MTINSETTQGEEFEFIGGAFVAGETEKKVIQT